MARATRSTTHPDTAPAPRKSGNKKRKRTSIPDSSEQPATKQQRTSQSQEPPDPASELPDTDTPTDNLGAGDVPIEPADAKKILLVLESIDTQGLLDRVFPLPTPASEAASGESAPTPSSSTSAQTFSFRTLLRDASQFPLHVLKSAIQHLFPISSHPRSRPSAPAAQQLRFCNLALALLDQASFHSVPTPLEAQSIFPTLFHPPSAGGDATEDSRPTPSSPQPARKPRYALVQHLPTGDWWTSLDSDSVSPSDSKPLTDLPTGHAELAAILPSPSTSGSTRGKTLADYVRPKPFTALQMPGPRRVSCGKFLDYGPYASFAPTFDQEGTEVGCQALGEVIWRQRREASLRDKARGKRRAIEAARLSGNSDDVDTSQPEATQGAGTSDEEFDEALQSLLPAEEVASIKAALGNLELEQAVQELLNKNARALVRLQRMQRLRLGADGGGSSKVEQGSEEWDTAQAILDSLTVLASLRPRSASHDSEAPLIPPARVLRTLQRSLPLEGTEGWYGTLPAGRLTALRDDMTVHVKPGAEPAATPTTTATAAAPAAPAKPAATASTPYTPYSYGNYQASQYRSTYQYTPGYGNNAAGTSTSSYYPNAQYGTQGQYSYPSYYQYQPSTPAHSPATPSGGGAAPSGQATPQSATTTPATMATNYASFFASSAQGQQGQRAVANTVTGATTKPYTGGTWTGTQGTPTSSYIAPLPAHLRSAATGGSTTTASQPTTPGATAPYSYYSNYQSTTPAAR